MYKIIIISIIASILSISSYADTGTSTSTTNSNGQQTTTTTQTTTTETVTTTQTNQPVKVKKQSDDSLYDKMRAGWNSFIDVLAGPKK